MTMIPYFLANVPTCYRMADQWLQGRTFCDPTSLIFCDFANYTSYLGYISKVYPAPNTKEKANSMVHKAIP